MMGHMNEKQTPFLYHLASVAICGGLILTAISWLHLCTTTCSDAHNYRIFGVPFEWVGSLFFLTLGFLHWKKKNNLLKLAVAAGLGASREDAVAGLGLQEDLFAVDREVELFAGGGQQLAPLCFEAHAGDRKSVV